VAEALRITEVVAATIRLSFTIPADSIDQGVDQCFELD